MSLKERLDVLLVRNRISSGRRVRRLLRSHEVCVNGKRVFSSGTLFDPEYDRLVIDGKNIFIPQELYIIMNKKKGTVCTSNSSDSYNIFESFPKEMLHPAGLGLLHSVGRLDMDTEGLLIFTTNGDFSHFITSPESHFPKTYRILLENPADLESQKIMKEKCLQGFFIPPEGREASFTCRSSELIFEDEKNCFLTISEGKYHQVKRMIAILGNKVASLRRTAIGDLKEDENLPSGKWREMTDSELEILMSRKKINDNQVKKL